MPLLRGAGAVNLQANQCDLVTRIGIDGDGIVGSGTCYRRPTVTVDGDRAGDGQRPVLTRIERRDDAWGCGQGIGVRERGAWLRDGARVGMIAG